MPEQKSTLTTDAIKSILKVNYNISVSNVSPLGHGSANCFCISDGNDMYFLKEYQSRFTESDLYRETCLINYLLKQKYPTAEIVPAIQGNLYLKYQDRFILLQKYVSGKTYVKQKLPHHLLMEASEWLGKLHSILRHYTLPYGMDIEWLKAFCPDKIAAEYDNLLVALEMQKNDIFYEHIKCDLLYKRDLVYQLSDFDNCYDGITYCASHGDYTCLQYICDNDHIVAIIDFSSAQTLPVIWEIMRSYVQSMFAAVKSGFYGGDKLKLKLVKLENGYKQQLFDMLDEWYSTGEKIVPYAIRKTDYHDFEKYRSSLEVQDRPDLVPDSTFFCLDEERNIFVGAVNIRHYLNESLLLNGGHIGDGVRPSERRKGIATQMIHLALLECKRLGIEKVLMVCDKENIGSAKSIINNGGVLENEVEEDGHIEQRYWIQL